MIQQRIRNKLMRVALPRQTEALRSALRTLDVDWPSLTARERESVISAARGALRAVPTHVLPAVKETLELEGPRIAGQTRERTVARFNLDIPSSLSLRDERLSEWAARSQGLFVRDQYGRWQDEFSQRARDTVASGLDRGLGRDDIASELQGAMESSGMARSDGYWKTIASTFVSRTRSAVSLSAFSEAGIAKMRWISLLDESTCEACRLMSDRVFGMKQAMDRIEAAAQSEDPDEIKSMTPFLGIGTDAEGNDVIYHGSGDDRAIVGRVDSFGEGEKDRVGQYSDVLDTSEMEASGITTPPAHPNCRCMLVAENA